MMLLKSASSVLCLCALVQSAVVQQRNIPVEVKYDEGNTDFNAKVPNDITEPISETPKLILEQQQDAVRNLDEKVQLSSGDLSQALKHLPLKDDDIPSKDLKGAHPEKVILEAVTPNVQNIIQQAESIIYTGLKKLRNSFKADEHQQAPDSQQWDDFEKAVNDYLTDEKTKLQLKQDQPAQPPQNQNFFQNIAQGFQTIANNFVQNLAGNQNANSNSTNQGDEQQGGQAQGPFQGFVAFFQNGVNNLVGSINGLGSQGATTSNTVLGDTGSTTAAPGFVSNFVNNVQQFLGQFQGVAQGGGSSGTQADTGNGTTSPSSPQRPGQIIQSIGSAINQFIQGRPPNAPADEGTATTQANVNIIQSIGNAIQNSPLNVFRPPTQKPAEDGSTTSNPIQAGISGVQNIGNQIQQLIPGQATSTEVPKLQEQVASNPPTQNEGVVNQIAQEQPKGLLLDQDIKEQHTEDTNQQTELPEEGTQTEENKEQIQEEVKGEAVKQQMEEQVKEEEIKEELRQEEKRENVEHEKKPEEDMKETLTTVIDKLD